jgi:hypothetical protein
MVKAKLDEIKPYKSWNFCKSNCVMYEMYEEEDSGSCRQELFCKDCMAYQMHQYLKANNQIIEEGLLSPASVRR